MFKCQRILQIVRGMDRKKQLLGVLAVPEMFSTRFVRKHGNRGILQFSGILRISNLSVFSADDGFDSSRLPKQKCRLNSSLVSMLYSSQWAKLRRRQSRFGSGVGPPLWAGISLSIRGNPSWSRASYFQKYRAIYLIVRLLYSRDSITPQSLLRVWWILRRS